MVAALALAAAHHSPGPGLLGLLIGAALIGLGIFLMKTGGDEIGCVLSFVGVCVVIAGIVALAHEL